MLVLACGLAGCGARESGQVAAAGVTPEARCQAALRDVRTWCTEGLRDVSPELRYNCLEARLRVSHACYPESE